MKLSIKAARTNRGMTQDELARALNVTKKTVSAWENGKAFPKVDKVDALCEVLGVKYDDIKWRA